MRRVEAGGESNDAVRRQHEHMLKLVAKGFYNELINYGVNRAEVLAVAGHLLDHVMQKGTAASQEARDYTETFRVREVQDAWSSSRRLSIHDVGIAPLASEGKALVAEWLAVPAIRDSFYPPFPRVASELDRYLSEPGREYFGIEHNGEPVGLIGAENIDAVSAKLEMRKLVGDPRMRGKGIGKHATFLFLYHAFRIRQFSKVYIHSLDANINNLNLNAKFGFELEGVFLEEAAVAGRRQDVVRMGLRSTVWSDLFG